MLLNRLIELRQRTSVRHLKKRSHELGHIRSDTQFLFVLVPSRSSFPESAAVLLRCLAGLLKLRLELLLLCFAGGVDLFDRVRGAVSVNVFRGW